jgi:predicted RND superfamily exporter protein
MVIGARGIYEALVLRRPVTTLISIALVTLFVGWFSQDFALDASADSLTLENDNDLRYYRQIRARYGSDDFLIVTYTPDQALFDNETLDDLRSLRDGLLALPMVGSVTSILDVPLVRSPAVELSNISSGIRYLENDDTDRALARQELLSSPLYQDLIVSSDGLTTALRVDLHEDEEYVYLRQRRDELHAKRADRSLSTLETSELGDVSARFDVASRGLVPQNRRNIQAIRKVLNQHRGSASLHLGGVPMIVADSIAFIRHDLILFGSAVLFLLAVILGVAFKQWRWVLLPMTTCAATCLFMFGLLGLLGWRVTVVSSNFVALLLILCLAMSLHIIVRYRETHERKPYADQFTLVSETISSVVTPCAYTALTTMVAFSSLLVSGIRPVIDFGWIMAIGMVVAFVFSFTLFPATLMLVKPGRPSSRNDRTAAITHFFASLVRRRRTAIVIGFSLLVLAGLAGVMQLTVESRFIDYYKRSTEIYQGMELIDRKLGGTTSLDVIINAPIADAVANEVPPSEDDDLSDFYADYDATQGGLSSRSYWYNSWKLGDVAEIHEYLDNLPDTGKVISLATLTMILEQLDEQVLHDNFQLSIIYERSSTDLKEKLFAPYLSDDGSQLRFSVRVFESDRTLQRSKLLTQIRSDLIKKFNLKDDQIQLTGMLVLYNNMLQSLFRSQILTLGTVFLAISLMFLVLFHSLRMTVTAIIPNVVSVILVLGLMGWFGIPFDLITITIAAITVGIGVDDTIHYVHRFQYEFAIDRDYWAAIGRCHRNIGRAIYYTSITVMLGFSILAFSQFVPTIYFGLLTSFAMLTALLANMVLLPTLIVAFSAGNDKSPVSALSTTARESP